MVLGAGPLISCFGLRDQDTLLNARIYLRITCGLIFFPFMNSILTGILTATGDSRTPFKANAVGLVINMALDPILIFGIGPFPVMGVTGAAVATVTAKIVVFLVFLLAVRQDTILFDKIKVWKRTSKGRCV